MVDASGETGKEEGVFGREVARKERRKLRSRGAPPPRVWSGLGLFGLVGWSVALPTLLGAVAGVWIDGRHETGHSWTLMLLVAGLGLGCWNAWRWVAREHRDLREEEERDE